MAVGAVVIVAIMIFTTIVVIAAVMVVMVMMAMMAKVFAILHLLVHFLYCRFAHVKHFPLHEETVSGQRVVEVHDNEIVTDFKDFAIEGMTFLVLQLDGGAHRHQVFAQSAVFHEDAFGRIHDLLFGRPSESVVGSDGEGKGVARFQTSQPFGKTFHDAAHAEHHHTWILFSSGFQYLAGSVVSLNGISQHTDFQVIYQHNVVIIGLQTYVFFAELPARYIQMA